MVKNTYHYTKQDITGIILAGGKNTRMGENKAFLKLNGQRIIDRTAKLLQEIFSQVILVTNAPLEYSYLDLEIVVDLIPQSGSLVGIYTGLFYSSYPQSFITACDMPFLNREVIEYLTTNSKNYDVVIPHLNDGYHPLHALYSKKCMKFIEELIRENNLKILDLFNRVKVRAVTTDEISSLDPTLKAFLNINTPDDLARVRGLG